MHEKFRGFTLIELLVVIAIISLLVSILLPSLNKAKDLARGVICQSNLHNISLAGQFYIQDYDGKFPVSHEGTASANPDTIWAARIASYLDMPTDWIVRVSSYSTGVFNCPMKPPLSENDVWYSRIDYGSNPFVCRDTYTRFSPECTLEDIANPANTCFAMDFIGHITVWYAWLNESYHNYQWVRDQTFVHNDMANVAYCDGHVKSEPVEPVADYDSADSFYWGRD